MKALQLFFLIVIASLGLQAQQVYQPDGITYESVFDISIDSLKLLGESIQNDTLRARVYGYIAYRYAYRDKEQEMLYLNKSLELAQQIHYQRGIGIVKNNLGGIYFDEKEYSTEQ